MLAREAIDTIYVFSSQMAQYLPAEPRAARDHGFLSTWIRPKFADYAKAAQRPDALADGARGGKLLAFEQATARSASMPACSSARPRPSCSGERPAPSERACDRERHRHRFLRSRRAVSSGRQRRSADRLHRPDGLPPQYRGGDLVRARHPAARSAPRIPMRVSRSSGATRPTRCSALAKRRR